MRFILLLLWGFVQAYSLQAQNVKIMGMVADSSGQAIAFAQVILYKSDQKSIISFAQSQEDGRYELQAPAQSGSTWLAVRALGYKAYFVEIPPFAADSPGLRFDARLNEDARVLQEVSVKAKLPGVVQEGDTTTYRVDEFKTGTERNVEDVLKKLPGVSVSEEGDVYFKGKRIKKLLIEGDDLFEQDYKIGTKNISAEMVDKIQAIENFSDLPHLKGIVDANDTVLNLTLKGDKSRPMGEMTLGAGPEERFDAKANLFYLQKKQKVFVLGHSNNTAFSPYNLSAATIGGAATNNLNNPLPLLIGLPLRFGNAGLSESRSNLNQVAFVNSNYFLKLSDKLTLRWNNQFFSDRNQLFKESSTEFLLQEQSFVLEEAQQSLLRPRMLASSLYLNYQPSAKTLIEYTLVGNQTLRRYENSLLYSVETAQNQNLLENARDDSRVWEQRWRYSRKLNARQALIWNANFSNFIRDDAHRLSSERFAVFFGRPQNQDQLLQSVEGRGYQGKNEVQWVWKPRERWRYQLVSEQYFLQSQLASGLALGQVGSLSPVEENDFNGQGRFHNFYTRLKAGASSRLFGKTFFNADLGLKYQESGFEATQGRILFVEPTLGIATNYRKFVLNMSYSFTRQSPALQQLYGTFVLNNYRTFQRGIEELRFLPTHNFNFIFNINDLERYQSLSLFGLYSESQPYYGTQNRIDENFSLVENAFFPRQRFLLLNMSADKYIHSLLSGFQWFSTFTYNSANNQANDFTLSTNEFYVLSSKLQYRSVFDGWYNIEASGQLLFNTTRNNLLENNRAADNSNTIYTLQQVLQPPSKRWKWILRAEHFAFRAANRQEGYFFLDTELFLDFKKPKMQLILELRNLLNNNQVAQASLSNFAITASQQRLQERWALLKVQFKI